MEKARKFTEDSDFTVNDRAHSSSKKSDDKIEERHYFGNGSFYSVPNT